MSRTRKKRMQRPIPYSLMESEVRLVSESDKWCEKTEFETSTKEVPWGYVVTIPKTYGTILLLDVEGKIPRIKECESEVMLQMVLSTEVPQYVIERHKGILRVRKVKEVV